MSEMALEHPLTSLTWADLKELVRQVLREERERELYINADGYLVFATEAGYRRYLETQKGKAPGKVKASYVDKQGYQCVYSDWEFTPEYAKQVATFGPGPYLPAEDVHERLRKRGVNI